MDGKKEKKWKDGTNLGGNYHYQRFKAISRWATFCSPRNKRFWRANKGERDAMNTLSIVKFVSFKVHSYYKVIALRCQYIQYRSLCPKSSQHHCISI